MTTGTPHPAPHPAPLPVTVPVPAALPGWIGSGLVDAPETAAFRSGAALALLHVATGAADLPRALWRDRLALAAAARAATATGRREDAPALRDALHLTRAGDDPGPGGRLLRQWARAVARPISVAALARALEGAPGGGAEDRIAFCLDATGATPVDRAAQAIDLALTDMPRGETAALILADAVLSRALGAEHLVPLLGLALTPRELRLRGETLRLACHRAVVAGVAQALPLAGDLARRAARLRAVVPVLRAKAAAQAVERFLSHDALPPAALGVLSDRAARRLCDRLVTLGVLRELTGRESFRLYGV